ncbi:MAG TPA: sugar ABC transporter ATP-binding protein [Phycisphaerae bacterium]|nr:sugar ABC transporter ATP-binding protein [Phycisphaerae bacterium]
MVETQATPRLEMRDIRKRFGATIALDGVSLRVMPGEVHALVGQNGAGKSTLMKTLSGAHAPDSGEMFLDGRPYAPRNPLEGRKRGVAMIYQELSLAPHLSVLENVLLGMEPGTLGFLHWREMKRRAREALVALGHGHLNPSRPVAGLSPATQQIIEIARALAIGCSVLVLDEPTSSLTQTDVAAMFDVIRRLKAQGKGIVYISHFLEEVRTIADRFTVLRDGKTVGSGDAPSTPATRMVELMVGRSVEQLYPRSPRHPGDEVLRIENLSGEVKPVGASIALWRGEVLGIAGLIGAGRTELLRAVFGLDRIRAGTVKLAINRPLSLQQASPAGMWKASVGMLSEDRKTEGLALTMSIADNLTLSDLAPLGPPGLIFPARQRSIARKWAWALAVKCRDVAQPIGDLSGGNQQKVAIARLLHHDVDVLLLDEPTRGIDVASKAAIYQLIDDLAAGKGGGKPKAVLVVSSYFPELLGICDRIAVMSRGVLGPAKPVEEWTEHALVLAATGQELPPPSPEDA